MAELPKPPLVVKDATACAVDMRRTIKNGMQSMLGKKVDVGPGSDHYITTTALGNELAVIGANGVLRGDAMMPDSAVGTDLKRQGDMIDRQKNPAVGSYGIIAIVASQQTSIETGRQLTDASSNRFEVTRGGIYANTEANIYVPVRALSVGASTNHAPGDLLQWASAPPFCDTNATVAGQGLINGNDAEEDEGYRSRILGVYRNPPGGGNPQQVIESGEGSHPSVVKCFCYPVVAGAGSMDACAIANPTATSKSRVIATAIMEGYVKPFMYGKFPVPPEGFNVTTVSDVNTDVALAISLPEAPTAQPPGLGGGWLDGTPWPAPDGLSYYKAVTTAVTDSSTFTVDAQTSPTANVTRISWVSPYDWKLYTALVTSVSGSAGAYDITIDSPFPGLTVGCYIFPAAQNMQTYVDAVFAHFAKLGPGEKTSNASALRRGFRHPAPVATPDSWPYSLGPAMLRALTDSGQEVASAQFLYRYDGTTTVNGTGGLLTPQPPATIASAPNILVPRHIGIYRITLA